MTAPDDVLRVATWNVRTGLGLDGRRSWPFRRHDAAAVLAELGCDVVALQEAHGWQLRSLRRALPDHVPLGAARGRWWGERCPLLVGPAVSVVRHRTRWLSGAPTAPGSRLPGASHPRIATMAELEVRTSGRRVLAVSTHLDQRRPANRVAGVELLLGWLDPALPAVVLGDLNAGPGAGPLGAIGDAGFATVLPAAAGGTAHRFTGRTDGPRIDHVLVRGPWRVVDAGVAHLRPGGRLASDHWPVRATLRLGDRRGDVHGDRHLGGAARRTIGACGSASSAPTA